MWAPPRRQVYSISQNRGVHLDEQAVGHRVSVRREVDDPNGRFTDVVGHLLNLTDELLHAAARDIEAVMFERVIDRLRAALPELVAAALREQLAPGD